MIATGFNFSTLFGDGHRSRLVRLVRLVSFRTLKFECVTGGKAHKAEDTSTRDPVFMGFSRRRLALTRWTRGF